MDCSEGPNSVFSSKKFKIRYYLCSPTENFIFTKVLYFLLKMHHF